VLETASTKAPPSVCKQQRSTSMLSLWSATLKHHNNAKKTPQGEPLKTGYWSIAEVGVASKLCEQSQEMHSAHVDSGIDTHRINARHTVHTFLTQKKYRAQTGLHL
jgi:hypothetical protein